MVVSGKKRHFAAKLDIELNGWRMKQYGKRYEPESGDVDFEYHHIIKGLYATFSSWHIDHSTFNNLQHYRKFYILFPDFRKVYEFVHNLNWTHIRRLLSENKKEGESSGYDTPSFWLFISFFSSSS